MQARIFCKLLDVIENKTNPGRFIIELQYEGSSFAFLLKILSGFLKNKNKKLIEISNYPSDKWEAAFRFWHKVIDCIVVELAIKKIDVICDTIEVNKENIKEFLKAEYGRHKIMYTKRNAVIIENASSTTYTFEELMNIINNTINFAHENQIDLSKYLDEYKELNKE